METARWIDWWDERDPAAPADRIYFGHETCAQRLPSWSRAAALARRVSDSGRAVTLVLPFLTERELAAALRLVESLAALLPSLEVVASDWGLLKELGCRRLAIPVLGRLLAGQYSDPRIARLVAPASPLPSRSALHVDGTVCDVARKAPSAQLRQHYQSCWIDRPDVVRLLQAWRIHRCELSNTGQGIVLDQIPGWAYSLHVPEVLVTVMRRCPECRTGSLGPDSGSSSPCPPGPIDWHADACAVPFFRRDNALFYACSQLPHNLAELPINRLVYRPAN